MVNGQDLLVRVSSLIEEVVVRRFTEGERAEVWGSVAGR